MARAMLSLPPPSPRNPNVGRVARTMSPVPPPSDSPGQWRWWHAQRGEDGVPTLTLMVGQLGAGDECFMEGAQESNWGTIPTLHPCGYGSGVIQRE